MLTAEELQAIRERTDRAAELARARWACNNVRADLLHFTTYLATLDDRAALLAHIDALTKQHADAIRAHNAEITRVLATLDGFAAFGVVNLDPECSLVVREGLARALSPRWQGGVPPPGIDQVLRETAPGAWAVATRNDAYPDDSAWMVDGFLIFWDHSPARWCQIRGAGLKTAAVQEGENATTRTVTRDAMGLCEVVTHPDGVVVRDYREEPAQGLTVADLVSILRANPKAALEAVAQAKIAGPAQRQTFTECRRSLDGVEMMNISFVAQLSGTGPTRADFDQAARDAGWVLVVA